MIRFLTCVCALALSSSVFSNSSWAQPAPANSISADSIHLRCAEEYLVAPGIAECLLEEEKNYGGRLAKVYERLVGQQDSLQEDRLRKSQRAWLQYQRHFCEFHEPHYKYEAPGTPFPHGYARAAYARCLLDTTLRRLGELRKLDRGDDVHKEVELGSAEGVSLPLRQEYGDRNGCYFLKHGEPPTDSFTYASEKGIFHYEVGCTILDVVDVKGTLSRSGILNAWSVKMICENDGDSFPEEVVIVESKGEDNKPVLELRYSSERGETLHACK